MYGLNGRNELDEMRQRYDAMVDLLSDLLYCGKWDIETLFDSKNNIEVGEITKRYVEETGNLPDWNAVYREAFLDFASEHKLIPGIDIDIYTNSSLDTHIYARKGLDLEIVEEFENMFGMNVEMEG